MERASGRNAVGSNPVPRTRPRIPIVVGIRGVCGSFNAMRMQRSCVFVNAAEMQKSRWPSRGERPAQLNSPVSVSTIAMVCCFACRSHPRIFISAYFVPSFLVGYRKVYSGRREADVVMSSVAHSVHLFLLN